jgi:flavin reductase (DIM6/NTAB) family NADH-FMN oxidoreductase RutF
MDCRLVQSIDVGMNTLFIAEVVEAYTDISSQPLIYHDRKYWKLSAI